METKKDLKKDLKEKIKKRKERKERKQRKNNLTILNSIKTNYLSWFFLFICITIISFPNLSIGFATFFVLLFSAYFWHAMSHVNKYISIIHHYHHEHNNFFSHFSQMLIELSMGAGPFFAHQLGYKCFDPFIVIFFTLFYTTIHNINYGTLHVNQVHREHHEELFCNLGPDICDVAFQTKSERDQDVENTDHYIPNIIFITIFVLILQYVCKYDCVYNCLIYFGNISYILIGLFLGISTAYLTMESLGYIDYIYEKIYEKIYD